MHEAWDLNAYIRHQQILSGQDVSSTEILCPTIINLANSDMREQTGSILEVGCGTGYLTNFLGKIAERVVGVDPSSKSVEIAKQYLSSSTNITVLCTSIEDFKSSATEPFDLVVANMALQVIPDINTTIQKIFNLLKPKGKFIFSIPHPCFWPIYKKLDLEGIYQYNKISSYTIPFTISNDRNPLPAPIPYYHRPIEYYTSILESLGFSILRILEPTPNITTAQKYQDPWIYPHFMIFESVITNTLRN
jgi:SAM-dependent methyltransferase